MKHYIILSVLFFLCLTTHAANDAQQQLKYYQAQVDSAEQEMNMTKMASAYGKIAELCRETPELQDKFAENLYQYGMWSSYAGDYQIAIHALVELLEIPDNPDNKKFKARAYMQLGTTYFFMERWDDALVHYQKALSMATELDDKNGISIAENNIGNVYQKKGNYQQAIEQYQHSLRLQEEIEDRETICNTYYNIGTCYRELAQYEKCLPFFNKALEIAKAIGYVEIQSLSFIELALYYTEAKREFHEAEWRIIEAEQLAENAGLNQVLKEAYLVRSTIEEEQGNFTLALDYYKKYKQLSDTLFNEHSVDKLREYEVRYQTQEKELEIVRQQTEINRQRTLHNIYIGVLVVAGLLLMMLISIARLRTKRNRELKEINATKDKFFSIISHDLKNPAIAQRNALQQLVEKEDLFDAETMSQYHAELLKSADYQVGLLYNLLNWAQVQTGRMPYKPNILDIVEVLRPEIAMIQKMAEVKNIGFNVQLPDNAIITGDRNMLTTAIRNLLTNAVKFTGKDGTITLDISRAGKVYVISISDTGVGMSAGQLQSLFRIDKQQSKAGTAGEQGSGLGLIVSKEFIEKHGSTLHIESVEGEGSRFWFEISVND